MDSLWALIEGASCLELDVGGKQRCGTDSLLPADTTDLAKDAKVSASATLRIFQTTESPLQHRGIPEDLAAQLCALLPPIVAPTYGSDLLIVRPQPGEHDAAAPAVERLPTRPWEWNEQIEPSAPVPSHRESFLPLQSVRNTASLSLSLFRAEGTRELLPAPSTSAWFPPAVTATSAIVTTPDSATAGGWAAIRSEQSYADELEGSSFARDHLSGLTAIALPEPDGSLPTKRAGSVGGHATGKAPTPTGAGPPSVSGAAATKMPVRPVKPVKRKASTSLASAPPSHRLKGSSAADAVVLDGADQLPEPSMMAGRKAGKSLAVKSAAGTGGLPKAVSSKKRKNSTA